MEKSVAPRENAKDPKPDLKLVSGSAPVKAPLQPPKSPRLLLQQISAWAKWIAAGLALAAAVFYGPIVIVDKIEQRDVVQTVVASGRVETPFRMNISTQVIAAVKDIPVAEGQTVRRGDVLI
jgi:multidrug efflux pump subunit AcrA (membrane-fusion protein)